MGQSLEDLYATQLFDLSLAGVKVIKKSDSWFFRALGKLVSVITFGRNNRFMTDFVTTIGNTIALPSNWDSRPTDSKIAVLEHEKVHVNDFNKYSVPLVAIGYLFVFFPIKFAYVRYRFERKGYLRGIIVAKQLNPFASLNVLVENAVEELCGPNYGWAWYSRDGARAWFKKQLGQ